MVYRWDDKEAECYRLYVEEKKSLDDVIAYWEARGFTPRKRAFQTQFKRWNFPSKQNPAHRNPALVARLHELWEQNCTQKDMVQTLQSEGHPINDRELTRLRLRLKLLLRDSGPRPKKQRTADGGIQKKTRKESPTALPGRALIKQLGNATGILAEESSSEQSEEEVPAQHVSTQQMPGEEDAPPCIEETLRKQLWQEQLRNESDEKWRLRKRRRRTRGWAGLPADAPGEPPRFPSETTIDEAKAYLQLDNDMYRHVRESFQQICRDHHVIKKTIAGPRKWADIVRQLINENEHLSVVFQQETDVHSSIHALFRPKSQKALSLDVICMDVTKRLRTIDSRMTLADVKNILCLNPEQTRQVRGAFAEKLRMHHYTNKHEAGEQHWVDLKTAWVNESKLLMSALSGGEADPEYHRKLRAIEVLAKDITKRHQQERSANDPTRKKQIHQGPGPGPAKPVMTPQPPPPRNKSQPIHRSEAQNTTQANHGNMTVLASAADLQIDPSLLLAASDAAILPTQTYQPDHQSQSQIQNQNQQHPHLYHPSQPPFPYPNQQQQHYPPPPPQPPIPLPIYFRLHPLSTTPLPSKTVWLSILHHPTIHDVRTLASREHPGCLALKLQGLITYKAEQGDREVLVDVEDDEELGAYLRLVKSVSEGEGQGQGQGRGKATFVVVLSMGGSYV